MVLGLAGGVGTAVALTRTAATSSTSGDTDSAIYVTWGQTAETDYADVTGLKAKEPQYRYVVVSSNSSKSVSGTFTLTFTLNVGSDSADDTTNYVLTGLTVDVYSVDTYQKTEFSDTDKKIKTLSSAEGGDLTCSDETTIAANNSSAQSFTKYYTLVFTWDGTAIGEGNTFGGSLAITQSFAE